MDDEFYDISIDASDTEFAEEDEDNEDNDDNKNKEDKEEKEDKDENEEQVIEEKQASNTKQAIPTPPNPLPKIPPTIRTQWMGILPTPAFPPIHVNHTTRPWVPHKPPPFTQPPPLLKWSQPTPINMNHYLPPPTTYFPTHNPQRFPRYPHPYHFKQEQQ